MKVQHFDQVCDCVIGFEWLNGIAVPQFGFNICEIHEKETLQETWDAVRAENLMLCQWQQQVVEDLPLDKKEAILDENNEVVGYMPLTQFGWQWDEDRSLILVLCAGEEDLKTYMEGQNYTVIIEE